MNKIICIMGKSASGKDTIAKALLRNSEMLLLTKCTTRPMRKEESELNPYHFVTEETVNDEMIGISFYERTDGGFYYGFMKQKLDNQDYIAVVDPSQVPELCRFYQGKEIILIIVETDEESRILHAINREEKNDKNYEELCRRIVADANDFSEDNETFKNACNSVSWVLRFYNDYQMTPDELSLEILSYITE